MSNQVKIKHILFWTNSKEDIIMVFADSRWGQGLSTPSGDSHSFSCKHVLVAEHNSRIAKYSQRILEKHFRCTVVTCSNGFDAIAHLDSTAFDALVCAIDLPGLSGLELAKEAHSAFPDIGVIVTGDQTRRFPYVDAMRAGAMDFIYKPFLPQELLAKLIRIFNEAALRNKRRMETLKYKSLFDLSIDGMALLDAGGSVIKDVNKSLLELMGEKKNNLVGKPVSILMDAEDRYRFEQWLSLCTLIGRGAIADLKLTHALDSKVYVDVSMTVVKNEAQFGIFLVLKNITERREMQLRLDEITQRDLLTGLFNRRSFVNRVHGAVRSAQEYNIPTTLMMIDIDGLKTFNDEHGHAMGDQMLVEVAAAISIHIHPSTGDACFRFDGDEFAVLLTGVDVEESALIAKRIEEEFYSRDTRGLTITVGMAEYQNSQTMDEFVRTAETAVHEAKQRAKDEVNTVNL